MVRNSSALILTSLFISALLGYPESAAVWAAPTDEDVFQAPSENTEVLTHGPIHEAFAQPLSLDSEEAFRISRTPPTLIEEIPPEEKPQGDHVIWIPGYWSWDEDRDDFFWVSGCWRAVPPNRSWVPGYWRDIGGGYEWVAGFWAPANTEKIEYLPSPPDTLEIGPAAVAPNPDMIWVPGCWVWRPGFLWRPGHYAWRPGFWLPAQTNWVWEPDHYVYTPQGCVFVSGFWDYTLEQRGVAFLPVYCPPRMYTRIGFRLSPRIVIDVNILDWNLFCRPRHHHYYFGDYYAAEYRPTGIYPWHEALQQHNRYDPIYVHEQWRHRGDRKWQDNLRSEYEHRRNDRTLRPARTYTAMETQVARLPEQERPKMRVARPLAEVAGEGTKEVKFERLDGRRREEAEEIGQKLRVYEEQRVRWEAPAAGAKTMMERRQAKSPDEPEATKPEVRTTGPKTGGKAEHVEQRIKPRSVKVPKSPITASRKRPSVKETTPPPKPKEPGVDTKVHPKSQKDERGDKEKGR